MYFYSRIKISSIVTLVLLMGVILYLSFSVDEKEQTKINLIEIEGNIHLPKDQYYKFANLEDYSGYLNLTPAIVKDRLEKHPYIERIDLVLDKSNLLVNIKEKDFEALLIFGEKQFLITNRNQTIPVIPSSENIDYPIISNPSDVKDIDEFSSVKNSNDIITGLKIVTTFKLINPNLFEELSEVDLRNGGDIILYFALFNYPVVIGRNNEIRKVFYFSELWNNLRNDELNGFLDYIDLRFSKHIFLGRSSLASAEKGTNS